VKENLFSLELYHGPTMAFKDVGARFMARVMAYFVQEKWKQPVRIVVATSGDTGSAVAAGFYGVEGIEVFILYPQGKVSPLQEKQLTTWGGNIQAIEVKGSFDDCQRFAKQILSDQELKNKGWYSSANSINIARLIPQSFYYALAYKELKKWNKPICVCVPSGNFGNISAGIMLNMMGLPIQHFLAATNANDVFPRYLKSGEFRSMPSKQTISNAMDVGAPSNFERLQQWFQNDVEVFKQKMSSVSVDDNTTSETLLSVYRNEGYLLDPHGAVGYDAMNEFLKENENYVGVFLETAHPAKFVEVVEGILNEKIRIPERLMEFMKKDKMSLECEVDYEAIKNLVSF
jgi:threonine synthase